MMLLSALASGNWILRRKSSVEPAINLTGQPALWQAILSILRASANRSRSARRSSLPTVAGPDFSDESPHDDDYIGEGDPEVDHPPLTLRTPCELLVGVVPRVGTLYDPALRGR